MAGSITAELFPAVAERVGDYCNALDDAYPEVTRYVTAPGLDRRYMTTCVVAGGLAIDIVERPGEVADPEGPEFITRYAVDPQAPNEIGVWRRQSRPPEQATEFVHFVGEVYRRRLQDLLLAISGLQQDVQARRTGPQ